jgi:hypothetical protein
VAPGQYFDIPGTPAGSTQWQETFESTIGLSVALSQTAQVTANGIQAFKQTDVVTDWLAKFVFAGTYTQGTGQTLTASAYAPFNAIGPVQLQIQNQYSSVKVESGIDWYIFNLIRAPRAPRTAGEVNLGANPAGSQVGSTALGYYAAALAQANQFAASWTTSSTSWETLLRLPAAQWFDSYFDLAPTGELMSAPHSALVSPQYMAGTTRQIIPSIVFNQGIGPTTDVAPVYTTALTASGDTASTFTAATCALTFRRQAIYAGNPAVLPPVYGWQYAWQTTRFGVAGKSVIPLLIPLEAGQVLCIYVRFFDPSASSGVGAPININVVTKAQLQYGSGLLRFDDTPDTMQQRWMLQHQSMLPQGVFAWDLAMDDRGTISNKRALNLLTTAGCQVYFETGTTTLSSTAYAVMGIESLVYVS